MSEYGNRTGTGAITLIKWTGLRCSILKVSDNKMLTKSAGVTYLKKCAKNIRKNAITDAALSETDYYFENGLRHVFPYYFLQRYPPKRRWIGKSIQEIYDSKTELRIKSMGYPEDIIAKGMFRINGENVTTFDQVLKPNDHLQNLIHRHEWPVRNLPIEIIHEDSNLLVVNKPPSIPVHPCGAFRHNSLIFILAKEYGYRNINTFNRLDRLTSGVLIYGKNTDTIQKLNRQMHRKQVHKTYVCKVIGKFPSKEIVCDANIKKVNETAFGILSACPRDVEGSKKCLTKFNLMWTDGNTSIVQCQPITGRTHQIRVHLQYLGFPIINDPLYNHWGWGDERFERGFITKPLVEVAKDIQNSRSQEYLKDVLDQIKINLQKVKNGEDCNHVNNESLNLVNKSPNHVNKSPNHIVYDSTCFECLKPLPETKLYELQIWLHAYKYKGSGWEFEAPLPDWAVQKT